MKQTNTQYSLYNLQKIFIFLFAVALYSNTLFFDYTLDDTLMITQNKFTKEGVSGIKNIMTNDAFVGFFGKSKNLLPGGRYRPLSQVCFALEYQLFNGNKPFIGHLINVVLYAFLCVFVFSLLKLMFNSSFRDKTGSFNKLFKADNLFNIPFIAAVLFVAHPLHTEVVSNIKGRDEIMSLLGSVAVVFFSLKYVDKQKFLFLLFSGIVFFLALLAKENAITFFAVIPLTIFVFRSGANMKNLKKSYLFTLFPLLLSLVFYFIIRYWALGFMVSNNAFEKELLNNPFLEANTIEKYATIIFTWLKYLYLLFVPYHLTHDYYPRQIAITNFSDFWVLFSVAVYLFLIGYSLWNLRKRSIVAYSILFFVITFSIQSNLVFNIGTFMNERFMFVSLLGFCIILAYFINKYYKSYKTGVLFLTAFILVLYSLRTFSRNFVWQDDYTLFTTDAKNSPNSAKCNVSAGGLSYEKAKTLTDSLEKKAMLEQALQYLYKGVDIHKTYLAGWILIGNVYLEMPDYAKAAENYANVLRMSPGHPDAANNILYTAQKARKIKDFKTAENALKILIKDKPLNMDYLYELSLTLVERGRIDTAIITLNSILAKDSLYYNAYNKLGEVNGRYLNNLNKSIDYLLKGYNIKKDDPSILENLGVAFGIKGDYVKSEFFFLKALDLKPDDKQIMQNLVGTYNNMKEFKKAEELLKKIKN
ncbi:MAG: tetratricopeptide repeat protein [Bacteroidales bacterium]|nr:tetratricopeptide repeat protein [Bacteroidales bacterium]